MNKNFLHKQPIARIMFFITCFSFLSFSLMTISYAQEGKCFQVLSSALSNLKNASLEKPNVKLIQEKKMVSVRIPGKGWGIRTFPISEKAYYLMSYYGQGAGIWLESVLTFYNESTYVSVNEILFFMKNIPQGARRLTARENTFKKPSLKNSFNIHDGKIPDFARDYFSYKTVKTETTMHDYYYGQPLMQGTASLVAHMIRKLVVPPTIKEVKLIIRGISSAKDREEILYRLTLTFPNQHYSF